MSIMKNFLKILISLAVLHIFLGCSPSRDDKEQMLGTAQFECVKLNQCYDGVLNEVFKRYMGGNAKMKRTGRILENMMERVFLLNASMGIDCFQYGENGKPIVSVDANGKQSPNKMLPKSVKLGYIRLTDKELDEMIENSRKEILLLNQFVNDNLSELLFVIDSQSYPDMEYQYAVTYLSDLQGQIIRVNEALGIDCEIEKVDHLQLTIVEEDGEQKIKGTPYQIVAEGDKVIYKILPYELRLKN